MWNFPSLLPTVPEGLLRGFRSGKAVLCFGGSEKEVDVRQSELFQVIGEFLEGRFSDETCSCCGSVLEYLDGQF
jgi:hypothetical protein